SAITVATSRMSMLYARAIHGWAYVLLMFWSLMLLIFAVARLVYTLRPRGDRFLNNGRPFYEPTIVELLICAVLGMIFGAMMVFTLRTHRGMGPLSKNGFETAVLAILWFLWVGGAGSATTTWPDLNFCIQFSTCRVLQAMMAWAWLGWITITLILLTSIAFAWRNDWDWHKQAYRAWEIKAVTTSNFAFEGGNHASGQTTGEPSAKDGSDRPPQDEETAFTLNNYDIERWKRAVTWL
ncbi:hypothetical protein CPB86DRAFT_682614, partial [Serendipita vermifera]